MHREHGQIQVLGSAYDAPRRKTSNVKWGNQEQWTTKWNSCVVRIYLLFLMVHSKTGCLTLITLLNKLGSQEGVKINKPGLRHSSGQDSIQPRTGNPCQRQLVLKMKGQGWWLGFVGFFFFNTLHITEVLWIFWNTEVVWCARQMKKYIKWVAGSLKVVSYRTVTQYLHSNCLHVSLFKRCVPNSLWGLLCC